MKIASNGGRKPQKEEKKQPSNENPKIHSHHQIPFAHIFIHENQLNAQIIYSKFQVTNSAPK